MKTCNNCGTVNQDESTFCSVCGQQLPEAPAPVYANPAPAVQEKNPSTLWLVLNIVLTVLCCGACVPTITGIIGIIMAALGGSAFNKGDIEGCKGKVKVAKIMFIIGMVFAVIGLIAGILYIVFMGGLGALLGIMEGM